MKEILTELNAHYRSEYEEATKRLQNTTKLLTSLLVATTGILAAAVATFVPACTCTNYNINVFEIVLFAMNVTCTLCAYIVDIVGLIPFHAIERLYMCCGKTSENLYDGIIKIITRECDSQSSHKISEKELLYSNYAKLHNDEIDLDMRQYYSAKSNLANMFNRRKQKLLWITMAFSVLSVIMLVALITVSLI